MPPAGRSHPRAAGSCTQCCGAASAASRVPRACQAGPGTVIRSTRPGVIPATASRRFRRSERPWSSGTGAKPKNRSWWWREPSIPSQPRSSALPRSGRSIRGTVDDSLFDDDELLAELEGFAAKTDGLLTLVEADTAHADLQAFLAPPVGSSTPLDEDAFVALPPAALTARTDALLEVARRSADRDAAEALD